MSAVQGWANANQEWIKTKVVEYAEKFATWIKSVDWGKVGTELETVAGNVRDIAGALADAVKNVDSNSTLFKAFEAFGAMMAVSVLARLTGISTALGVLGKVPIPPVLASALGLAGTVAAGASAESTPDAETQKRQADFYKQNPNSNKTVFGALADWWKGNASTAAGGAGTEAQVRAAEVDKTRAAEQAATDAANAKSGQGKGFVADVWTYFKSKVGFGDDPKIKDGIADTAKATGEIRDILKAQKDGIGSDGVTTSSGGLGGSGQHVGGGSSPGAALGDHAGASRPAKGALAANQKEAYAAALKEGLSPTAARALVANMSGEGLAVPKDYHWDSTHMASGIVQWDPQRSAAIKGKFGAMPHELSVGDQTRAAIWEMKTNPSYAKTWAALQGSDSTAMIDALVRNYENPRDKNGAISTRLGYLKGFNPTEGSPSAQAPIPAGTSAAAITDAEVFAAQQRILNGSRDPKDKALVDRYHREQATSASSATSLRHPVSRAPTASLQHPASHTYDSAANSLLHAYHASAHRGPSGPITVELTDRSAEKVGQHTGRAMIGDRYKAAVGQRSKAMTRDIFSDAGSRDHVAALSRMVHMASAIQHSSSSSNHHTETRIGEMHVHTPANDGQQFASQFRQDMMRRGDVVQANGALA